MLAKEITETSVVASLRGNYKANIHKYIFGLKEHLKYYTQLTDTKRSFLKIKFTNRLTQTRQCKETGTLMKSRSVALKEEQRQQRRRR